MALHSRPRLASSQLRTRRASAARDALDILDVLDVVSTSDMSVVICTCPTPHTVEVGVSVLRAKPPCR